MSASSSVGGGVAFSNPPPWSWSRWFCWLFFFFFNPSIQGGSRGNIMELHPEALCIIWCATPIVFMYSFLSFLVIGHFLLFFPLELLVANLKGFDAVFIKVRSSANTKLIQKWPLIYWGRKTQKSNPVIIYDLFIVKNCHFCSYFHLFKLHLCFTQCNANQEKFYAHSLHVRRPFARLICAWFLLDVLRWLESV